MKLEDIGFYTLSDYRASQTSKKSPLWRCELILTDKCNFKCKYCRGLKRDIIGTLPFCKAVEIVKYWGKHGLKNVRFSGGEPTLYDNLPLLVKVSKSYGIKRVAISTNGSADYSIYHELIEAGVNDFSVSLDSCCATENNKIAGSKVGMWEKITENIRKISEKVYTTIGCVINEDNIDNCVDTILFADTLGVADIRMIPSAQYNKLLSITKKLPQKILKKYPILKYRTNNILNNRNVRGLKNTDSKKCFLVLDDMAIAQNYHFPCIIYLREGGNPIGEVGKNIRKERYEWMKMHNCYEDEICKKNCLDVCIDYNNKTKEFTNEKESKEEKKDS